MRAQGGPRLGPQVGFRRRSIHVPAAHVIHVRPARAVDLVEARRGGSRRRIPAWIVYADGAELTSRLRSNMLKNASLVCSGDTTRRTSDGDAILGALAPKKALATERATDLDSASWPSSDLCWRPRREPAVGHRSPKKPALEEDRMRARSSGDLAIAVRAGCPRAGGAAWSPPRSRASSRARLDRRHRGAEGRRDRAKSGRWVSASSGAARRTPPPASRRRRRWVRAEMSKPSDPCSRARRRARTRLGRVGDGRERLADGRRALEAARAGGTARRNRGAIGGASTAAAVSRGSRASANATRRRAATRGTAATPGRPRRRRRRSGPPAGARDRGSSRASAAEPEDCVQDSSAAAGPMWTRRRRGGARLETPRTPACRPAAPRPPIRGVAATSSRARRRHLRRRR